MAEKDSAAKTAAAVGVGGLIAITTAILTSRKAGAAPENMVALDEAAMNLLMALAQAGEAIDQNTLDALGKLAGIKDSIDALAGGLGITVLENPPEITAFTVYVNALQTPVNLPDRAIPFDQTLVIKALPTNLGLIYVANTAPESMNPNSSYWLIGNEAIEYKIENSNHLWITATRVGEGVVCTVEQKGMRG